MNVPKSNPRSFRLFAILLLSLFSWPTSIAQANEPRACAKEVLDWVGRADTEHPAHVRAVECFPGHVHLQLEIAHSPPLDVDLAIPAGRSFRTIGRLGASPMLEVHDFSEVPAPQREAFELLCTWLEKHEREVTQANIVPVPVLRRIPPVQDSLVGNLWSRTIWMTVLGIITCVAMGAARRVRTTERGRRDSRMFGGLFLASLLLRWSFGTFGPHHVNGQGPAWIIAAHVDPTRLAGYGPGYHELFSLLCEAFPRSQDTAIFAANMILGALAAPLLFALARHCDLNPGRATLAGAILAVDALSIRMNATEAYFTPIITLTLGAALFFVWSFERLQKSDRIRGAGLALLGALLTVQAARIHPVAWGPLALGPSFMLASKAHGATPKPWPWQFGVISAMVLLVLVLLGVTSGRTIASVVWNVNRYWSTSVGIETVRVAVLDHVPQGIVLGAILWILVKPRGLLVPAIASCMALLATRNVYTQSAIWVASYERLWLAAPVLALASMVPAALFRSKRTQFTLGAAIVLFFLAGWSTMHERTTEQLEYAFFRDAFSSLPSGCRVVHVGRVDKRIVALPEYALPTATDARNVVDVSSPGSDLPSLLRSGVCLRYARTSLCTSPEGRPVCAAIESQLPLIPLVERDFPAKPSHITSTYDRDIVRVGWFDVITPNE